MENQEKRLWSMLIKQCREKGFSDSAIINIYFLCGCDQMHDAGYTSEEALEKAIELVKTKSKEKVYSELLKMTGYKED